MIAYLAIGERSFYLPADDADATLAALRAARDSGDWVTIRDASGHELRLLIPGGALLVFQTYDVDSTNDDVGPEIAWVDLDF